MDKYELLSKAVDLSFDDKNKEAWKMIYQADKLAGEVDHIYGNIRHAVCLTVTANKKMCRRAVKKDE